MTNQSIEHEPRDPLDFTPVPHGAKRSDGWTPTRQREFIETLAAIGSVTGAAKAVGLQPCGAYKLRNKAGGHSFAQAWDAAVFRGTQAVRDVMIDHAMNGIPDPIFHGGKQVGEKRRFNTRGQQWLVEKSFEAAETQRLREKREAAPGQQGKLMAMLQQFVDGQRRWLIASLDTPDKKAAFRMLWGSMEGYPFEIGERASADSWASALVACEMIDGARKLSATPRDTPIEDLARVRAWMGRHAAPEGAGEGEEAVTSAESAGG